MRCSILALGLVVAQAGMARAELLLSTSNPASMPLMLTAGMGSGPMFVTVTSDNPGSDFMSAWNIQLEIRPIAGASGTLQFLEPSTGSPADPPNYVFQGDGIGISATNSGNVVSANDFYDFSNGNGVLVPSMAGANLLQLTFLASTDASGLFGIYADRGTALTQWTDDSFDSRVFTNVPDGSGTVLLGEVLVLTASVVPEPPTIITFGLGSLALAASSWNRQGQRRSGLLQKNSHSPSSAPHKP